MAPAQHVVLETSMGQLTVELYVDHAPKVSLEHLQLSVLGHLEPVHPRSSPGRGAAWTCRTASVDGLGERSQWRGATRSGLDTCTGCCSIGRLAAWGRRGTYVARAEPVTWALGARPDAGPACSHLVVAARRPARTSSSSPRGATTMGPSSIASSLSVFFVHLLAEGGSQLADLLTLALAGPSPALIRTS